MAESIALAVLENLVHMSRQDFPRGYVGVAAFIPGDLPVLTEHDLRLRPDLHDLNAQTLGDRWIEDETAQNCSRSTRAISLRSATIRHLRWLDGLNGRAEIKRSKPERRCR
jgi:hypothetical protein